LCDQPLHSQTLARMEVETRGCWALTLELARLLGREEAGSATDQDLLLLRLLTPVAKLYTAKAAVSVLSEGLECFGGQGYIEDTGLPGMLRDAQVLPIWEGTTSVNSLDVLRALQKTRGEAMVALQERVAAAAAAAGPALQEPAAAVTRALQQLQTSLQAGPEAAQAMARDFSFSLAQTFIAGLLLEQAAGSRLPADCTVATRWCQRELCPVSALGWDRYSPASTAEDREMVYQGYSRENASPPLFVR